MQDLLAVKVGQRTKRSILIDPPDPLVILSGADCAYAFKGDSLPSRSHTTPISVMGQPWRRRELRGLCDS